MGRPRLGIELKKPRDYQYDYPEQRDISAFLSTQDITLIAEKTNYSKDTIYLWCDGRRRNSKIESLARILSEANRNKLEMIEQMTQNTN